MVPWMSLVAKISMVVDPVVGLTGVLLLDGWEAELDEAGGLEELAGWLELDGWLG